MAFAIALGACGGSSPIEKVQRSLRSSFEAEGEPVTHVACRSAKAGRLSCSVTHAGVRDRCEGRLRDPTGHVEDGYRLACRHRNAHQREPTRRPETQPPAREPDPAAQVPDIDGRDCHAAGRFRSGPPGLGVLEAAGMTCRQGVRVIRHVAPSLPKNYYDRLGSVRNKPIAGYRCSGYLVGDAAWLILCRRGRRAVLASAAE